MWFHIGRYVTFQVSETGHWHRESNVKIIIYAYESDDSSDILLNEKWNYKKYNQHTKIVSNFFYLGFNQFTQMKPKIFFVREVNPQTSQLTCKIGVTFFVQEIHSSSQMKLKMIIRIESEATNIIINMQKHVRIFLN